MHRRTIDSLMALALLLPGAAAAEVTNRIVARVNDRILTLHDVNIRRANSRGNAYDQLVMDVTAKTYRYLDDDEIAAARKQSRK